MVEIQTPQKLRRSFPFFDKLLPQIPKSQNTLESVELSKAGIAIPAPPVVPQVP